VIEIETVFGMSSACVSAAWFHTSDTDGSFAFRTVAVNGLVRCLPVSHCIMGEWT
jgi:hypothetical protein